MAEPQQHITGYDVIVFGLYPSPAAPARPTMQCREEPTVATEPVPSRTVSREQIRAALELLGVDPAATTWLRIEPTRITWQHIGPDVPNDATRLPASAQPLDGVILMRDVE